MLVFSILTYALINIVALRPNSCTTTARPVGRPFQDEAFVAGDRAIDGERHFGWAGADLGKDIAVHNLR